MNFEEIMNIAIAYAPSVSAVVAVIVATIKMIKEFKHTSDDVKTIAENAELKSNLNRLLKDNAELRYEIKKINNKLSNVKSNVKER